MFAGTGQDGGDVNEHCKTSVASFSREGTILGTQGVRLSARFVPLGVRKISPASKSQKVDPDFGWPAL